MTLNAIAARWLLDSGKFDGLTKHGKKVVRMRHKIHASVCRVAPVNVSYDDKLRNDMEQLQQNRTVLGDLGWLN